MAVRFLKILFKMKKNFLVILTVSAIHLFGAHQAHATDILKTGQIFQSNTSDLQNLMKLVGQARSLAITGCPEAVELIIRSYNAYLYREKPGAVSFTNLVKQVERCEQK
jgi:hypothetical protein